AAALAAAALREPRIESEVTATLAERERVRSALAAAGFETPVVQANFVVARSSSAPGLAAGLESRGLVVRAYEESLRITVRWPTARSSLLRLRHHPDVRLRLLPVAEDLPRLVVRDRAGDDHVLALLPVHGRRDAVLGSQLQRVDHAQHLVEVAAGRHRVDENQLDLLVGPDHEDVTDRLVVGRRARSGIARHARGQHP